MRIKNELNKIEVDELFKLKQSKNITNLDIARKLNYTHSTISGLFNKYVASELSFNAIKNYIKNAEFKCIELKQNYYGKLEVDNRESDVIIIAMIEKNETNLIQIERENLKKLIKILKQQIK